MGWLSWVSRRVLNVITCVLLRGGWEIQCGQKRGQWEHRGRLEWCDHQPMDAGSHQKLEEPGTGSPMNLSEEHCPADTFILAPGYWHQTSGLHNCQRIHFCYFKPSSLWYFLITAAGNWYPLPQMCGFCGFTCWEAVNGADIRGAQEIWFHSACPAFFPASPASASLFYPR